MSILEKKLKVFYLKEAPPSRLATPKAEKPKNIIQKAKQAFEDFTGQNDDYMNYYNEDPDSNNSESQPVATPTNPENEKVGNENEKAQNLEHVITPNGEALANENAELKKQLAELDANSSAQIGELTSRLESQQNQIGGLTKAVELLVQQGQSASPEAVKQQISETRHQVKSEAIDEMKKPRFLDKVRSMFTGDLTKSIRNAPPLAKALVVALSLGGVFLATSGMLPVITVAMGGSTVISTAFSAGGLAGMFGVTNVAAAVTLKTAMLGAAAVGLSGAFSPSDKKIQQPQQPPTETPAPQLQETVVKEQVQQATAPEQIVNPEMVERAEAIMGGLREIEPELISFPSTNNNKQTTIELAAYSSNQFSMKQTDEIGNSSTSVFSEDEFMRALLNSDEKTVTTIQSQIEAKIAAKNKPVEEEAPETPTSPETNENPTELNLNEQPVGTKILLTGDSGQKIEIVVVGKDDQKSFKISDNTGRSFTGEVYTLNIDTADKQKGVVSTAENETVYLQSGTRDYPYVIENIEVVKPTTPQSETPAESPKPSPETTKSPEAISQSAYAEIGKNLEKINKTANLSSSDLFENLSDKIPEILGTEYSPFSSNEELNNKFDGLMVSLTANENISDLLGNETVGFSDLKYNNQDLINTCLSLEINGNPAPNKIPENISRYQGEDADLLGLIGKHLETAKLILDTNEEIDSAKEASKIYSNDNVQAAVVVAKLLKSENPIIKTQIPEFKTKEANGSDKVWKEDELINSIESDAKADKDSMIAKEASENGVEIIKLIVKFGNSYREVKTPE
jgi:hypothetical protein